MSRLSSQITRAANYATFGHRYFSHPGAFFPTYVRQYTLRSAALALWHHLLLDRGQHDGFIYTSLFYLFLRQSQVYSLPAGMSERPSGGYGASGRLDQVSSLGNAESIVLHGKLGGVTGLEGAVQHLLGHGVFHLALDGPAQGTGPVLLLVQWVL